MLTDYERNKIRLEEEYRAEVRATFPDKKGKTHEFLNSPFGLFLLSSVFLSVLTGSYTKCQNVREERLRRAAVVERLDIEISYRFPVVLMQLRDASLRQRSAQIVANRLSVDGAPAAFDRVAQMQGFRVTNREILDMLRRDPAGEYPRLYSDFKDDSPLVLMARLRAELAQTSDTRELDRTIAAIASGEVPVGLELSNSRLVAAHVIDGVMLSRWKKGYFRLTNCTASNPFC